MNHSVAILNSETRMNPAKPQDAEYFDIGQVVYIVKLGKSLRTVTSFGTLSGFDLGSSHIFHADQSGRRLGVGTIVGINNLIGTQGEVPSKKMAHWVVK